MKSEINKVRIFYMYAPTVTVSGQKRARPRKPTLVSVAKQVSKAAIAVQAYEVRPEGSVVVVIGKNEPEPTNDLDKWVAKHAH